MNTIATSASVAFFFAHAGYSYDPRHETAEDGRLRCAEHLAMAEHYARDHLTFEWGIDPTSDSSDWSDEEPPYHVWYCLARDTNHVVVASLGGIDFGRDGSPWHDPYRRVVEAELAMEARPQ